jgi:hypothetical protein
MKIRAISEIIQELEEYFGIFDKGGLTIAACEDIFMHPPDIETATRTPPHYKIIRHRSRRNHVLTTKKPHHSCPGANRRP